jgi:hypothetical protein
MSLTDAEVSAYLPFYPEYTPESVLRALLLCKAEHGHLDAITVQYFIVEECCGGRGIGELK